MIKFDSLRIGLAMAAFALVASCASSADLVTETPQPLGAWASGTDSDACETAPITYFSSDGVVLVLLAEGRSMRLAVGTAEATCSP